MDIKYKVCVKTLYPWPLPKITWFDDGNFTLMMLMFDILICSGGKVL